MRKDITDTKMAESGFEKLEIHEIIDGTAENGT